MKIAVVATLLGNFHANPFGPELQVKQMLEGPSGRRKGKKNMIPDYQACMLPLLKFASDDKTHTLPEAVTHIAKLFQLTEEEKQQMLPSGLQAVIFNRVGWARTYLKKAGLLEDPKRATFKITNRGLDLLKEKALLAFVWKDMVKWPNELRIA